MNLNHIRTLQDRREKVLEELEMAIVARDKTKCSDKKDKHLGLNDHVNECEARLRVLQQEVKKLRAPSTYITEILPSICIVL